MLKKILSFLFVILSVESILAVNDTLLVSNGDVLVGEIKSMERGVLVMETDYSDSDFKIEWDNVIKFQSERNFIVTLSEGERYYGKIYSDPTDGKKVIIIEAGIEHGANLIEIVYLDAVKKDFLSRLSLS